MTISNSTVEKSKGHGIQIYDASPSITGCEIRDNDDYGIYIEDSEATVTESIIDSNAKHGIYLKNSDATIANNTIASNASGIRVSSSAPTVTGNTIKENTEYAILLENQSLDTTLSDNMVSGNGTNPVVFGGTISESVTLDSEEPYVIISDWTVSEGVILTMKPGVVIKFDPGYNDIFVDGTLIADGTPEHPIYFTSLKDDSVGGDTNEDGNASTPSRGDWSDLKFNSKSSDNVLNNMVIRYGDGVDIHSSTLKLMVQMLPQSEVAQMPAYLPEVFLLRNLLKLTFLSHLPIM